MPLNLSWFNSHTKFMGKNPRISGRTRKCATAFRRPPLYYRERYPTSAKNSDRFFFSTHYASFPSLPPIIGNTVKARLPLIKIFITLIRFSRSKLEWMNCGNCGTWLTGERESNVWQFKPHPASYFIYLSQSMEYEHFRLDGVWVVEIDRITQIHCRTDGRSKAVFRLLSSESSALQ